MESRDYVETGRKCTAMKRLVRLPHTTAEVLEIHLASKFQAGAPWREHQIWERWAMNTIRVAVCQGETTWNAGTLPKGHGTKFCVQLLILGNFCSHSYCPLCLPSAEAYGLGLWSRADTPLSCAKFFPHAAEDIFLKHTLAIPAIFAFGGRQSPYLIGKSLATLCGVS